MAHNLAGLSGAVSCGHPGVRPFVPQATGGDTPLKSANCRALSLQAVSIEDFSWGARPGRADALIIDPDSHNNPCWGGSQLIGLGHLNALFVPHRRRRSRSFKYTVGDSRRGQPRKCRCGEGPISAGIVLLQAASSPRTSHCACKTRTSH
jgi:hypothetical protein